MIKIIKEAELGKRPEWDEYFMKCALDIASRASCYNVHAGCVIVFNKRILGTGYNGAPPGIKNCLDYGECFKEKRTGRKYEETLNTGNCIGVHAEMNALAHVNGIFNKGCTIYMSIFPCMSCAKTLISYEIKRIVFKRTYDEKETLRALKLFDEAGVEICRLDLSPERYIDLSFGGNNVKFGVWNPEEKERMKTLLSGIKKQEKLDNKLNLNLR